MTLEQQTMTVYSAFAVPTLGMMGQSHALNNIGNNIANISTGGFKRTDTNFSTLVSQRIDHQSDLGGMHPKDLQRVDQQGNMVSSASNMDLAINGQGFYIFNTKVDGSGDTFYGRDGAFDTKTVNDISVTGNGGTALTTKDGYIVDKNGYFLQGWTADSTTGLFSSTTLSSLRIDPYAFASTGVPTTTAALNLNLPANNTAGASQINSISLAGTIEAGDIYSATIDGTTVTYTTTGAEADLNAVRDGLISAINADATAAALVTASASPSTGALLLTSTSVGVSLTVSTAVTNGGATADNAAVSTQTQASSAGTPQSYAIEVIDSNGNPRTTWLEFTKTANNTWALAVTTPRIPVAQVDTVTLSGTPETGDGYNVVVNGTSVGYTVAPADTTLAAIRDKLLANINSDPVTGAAVTASAGATDGAIVLTAKTAGTSFTTTTSASNGGATSDNSSTVTTTISNTTSTTTTAVTTLVFDANGQLTSPTSKSVTLSLTFPAEGSYAAGTASVVMDVADMTQFAGDFLPVSFSKSGYAKANMRSFDFNAKGELIAKFDNSTYRSVYKVPLAQFSNPNALDAKNGNVYAETQESGNARVVAVDTSGYASFLPNTHELSNVDLAGEFSRMIMTQTAYNSSATVFKTIDEMVSTAGDLKR